MAAAERRFGRARLAWRLWGALGVAALLWGAGFALFVGATPAQVTDAETDTDAIVVLTGGPGRLDIGIDLLDRGLAPRMLISGVSPGVDLNDILGETRGPARVADGRIALDHAPIDTYGNSIETARWAEREGIGSVRIVTGYYHMPRSLFLFRRAMPEATLVPHPVYPRALPREAWWRLGQSTRILHDQYVKYLATVALAYAGLMASREAMTDANREPESRR